MAMRLRYSIYDAVQQKWLMSFQKPDKRCDAAVTRWTRNPEYAMKFPGTKSARGVAMWLDANGKGGCMVINAKGVAV